MESVNFTSDLVTNLVRSVEAEGHTSIAPCLTIPSSVVLFPSMAAHVYVHIFTYFLNKQNKKIVTQILRRHCSLERQGKKNVSNLNVPGQGDYIL